MPAKQKIYTRHRKCYYGTPLLFLKKTMQGENAKENEQSGLYLRKDAAGILLNQLFICKFASKELKQTILQLKSELNLISSSILSLDWFISSLCSSIESPDTAIQIQQFLEEQSQSSECKIFFLEEANNKSRSLPNDDLESSSNIIVNTAVHVRIAETILARSVSNEEIKSLDDLLECSQGDVSIYAEALFDSEEYKSRKDNERSILPHLSDAEYIIYLFNGILGRFPTTYEVWGWAYHHLIDDYTRKQAFAAIQASIDPLFLQNNLVLETFGRNKILNPGTNKHKPEHSGALIMGTNQHITVKDWDEIKSNLNKRSSNDFARIAKNSIFYKEHNTKTPDNPSLSIITSLYNGDKFIRNFMENMVNQINFDNFELIIIDACSPGDENTIIKEYMCKHPNIIYHRCEDRISIYDAWNLGVSMSKGKYLTNANLDDLRAPYGLSMQVECLERFPSFDICYGDFYYYFEANPSWNLIESIGIKSSLTHLSPGILISCNYPHCAPLWRKSLHQEVGLFDAKYASAADWEFWLRCIKAHKNFYFIPIPLSGYYQNPEGISTSSETKGIEEVASITNKHFKDLIMTDDSTLIIPDAKFNQLHIASRSLPRRSQLLLSYIELQSRYRSLNSSKSFVPVT
ncbi:putative beta-glycosyltransferase/ family 2 [Synechococcus sp. A15-62]|uniref:glycosyltransferase n=1 Tax=Synechococcus sp. A15-62 TaxID=1050657 RepID=UPI001646207F|nr:glycosyltransferase [Synechococcus sp. A15-62]QNI99009.1 putative beta-glycosyltransferase/ family 2 [Synechococcus sp. A15-62]